MQCYSMCTWTCIVHASHASYVERSGLMEKQQNAHLKCWRKAGNIYLLLWEILGRPVLGRIPGTLGVLDRLGWGMLS